MKQKYLKKKKTQQLKISYKKPQRIDAVLVYISQPEFYMRKADLMIKDSTIYKKRKPSYYMRSIKYFDLNSECLPLVYLNGLREREFYLQIENQDNPPLKIDSIACFQKKYFLIARLEKDKTYTLGIGNPKINQPQYDLEYFSSQIPKVLKTIKAGQVTYQENKVKEKVFAPDRKIVWTIIAFTALVLLFVTAKMLKSSENK